MAKIKPKHPIFPVESPVSPANLLGRSSIMEIQESAPVLDDPKDLDNWLDASDIDQETEQATPQIVKTGLGVVTPTEPKLTELDLQDEAQAIQEAQSEREARARKLPKPPGFTLKWPEFKKWIDKLTQPQWDHTMVYVYRMWPIIKRQLADPTAKNFIDKLSCSADCSLDYLKRVHGGGEYRFDVSDVDLRKQVCEGRVTIPWSEFEPKLVLEELVVGVQLNKPYVSYLQQKGILDVEGNKMEIKDKPTELGQLMSMNERLMQQIVALAQQQAKGSQPQPLDREVMMKQLETTSELYKQAMAGALKKDNVTEATQLGQTVDLLSKLAAMLQPKEQSGGMGMLQIVQMMQENAKHERELMMKMIELNSNKQASADPIDQVNKFFGLFERLQDARSDAPVGKRSTAEVLIDAATKVLPSISNVILAGFAAKKGATVQVSQAPQPQELIEGQTEEVQQTDEGKEAMANQASAQNIISQYGGMILGAINKGQTGDEFAEWVVDGFGMGTYNAIANYGKDAILAAMKATPAFWQQAQAIAPQVDRFVTEFLAYTQMLEETGSLTDDTTGA